MRPSGWKSTSQSPQVTWTKVGKYCDIREWMNVDCKVTSGDGGIGTVRVRFEAALASMKKIAEQ